MAARLKWREVPAGTALQRQTTQQMGLNDGMGAKVLKPKPLRAGGLKQCPDDKLQVAGEGLAPVYSQPQQIRDKKPKGESITQAPVASDMSKKKKGASQRKLPSYDNLAKVVLGVAPYRTSWQRFVEAQKNLLSQRNTRRKTALQRSASKTELGSTYEQIIAKQREYWRLKKREQRAKLSFKGKLRLKENYSRALKLHPHLQEEKAALGNAHVAVPETIGGFIKEDGTVSVSVSDERPGKEEHRGWSEASFNKTPQPSDVNWRSINANPPPPPFRPPQAVKRPQCRSSARATNGPKRTEVSHLHSSAQTVETFIINPLTPQNGGLKRGGCVLKMAVSNNAPSAPAVDAELTEKERIARKREYWRVKKREQRAACAARVKRSSLQARTVSEKKNGPEQISFNVNQPCESQNFPDNSMSELPNGRQREQSGSLGQYCQIVKETSPIQLSTSHSEDPDKLTFQEEPPEIVKSEIKTELGAEGLEPEVFPDFSVMVFEENESFVHSQLRGECKSSAPLSPFPSFYEPDLNPFCEGPFQNSMDVANSTEPSVGPSSEDKEQRILDKNPSRQIHSSPEPLNPHPLPFDSLSRHQCQEDQSPKANQCQIKPSSAPKLPHMGTKQSGLTGLLKQREYWKLMKRQQRARLKARKSAPRGESGNLLSGRNVQAPDVDPALFWMPTQGLFGTIQHQSKVNIKHVVRYSRPGRRRPNISFRRRVGASVWRHRRRRRRSHFGQNVEELLPHGSRPPEPPAGVHRVRGDAVPPQSDASEGPHRGGPPQQPDHVPGGEAANPGRLGRGGLPEGTLFHQPAPEAQRNSAAPFKIKALRLVLKRWNFTNLMAVFYFFFCLY
ncbi:unnamed protein product [Tetraodon nigroviridis]|uniref:(spotted green pufferfish) hypothetical protein n=1 Tax=Tetraodon nigroviridis TaxID=99883 RepID=Q4T3A2_TETNG|nr:unnamed protein product [Tetraodon nigroviridis]